jgi:hypothetical protein
MKIKLICCVGLDYDLDLIPHFTKHYSQYNINSYHFILNKSNEFDITDYLEYFSNLHPTEIVFEKWAGEFNAIDKIDKFNNIIEDSKEYHILLTDVDEFQNHKDDIVDDYVWGNLIDRESEDGLVKQVTSVDINQQFPIKSQKSEWKNTIKPCVFPSTERLKSSHYITTNYSEEKTIDVNHYRWTNTRLEKSKNRYDIHNRLNKEGKTFKSGAILDTYDSLKIINQLKPKSNI